MNLLISIVFVVLCAFVLYDQLSFHAILNRAKKLTGEGKHDDAINSLHAGLQRKFVTIPAPHAQIYYAIGMCYVDLKVYDKAIKYFQHVTKEPSSQKYRTQAPERLKECQQALAELKPAPATYTFSDKQETAESCLKNGNSQFAESRFDEACLLYERGLRLADNPRSITSLRLIARLSIASLGAGKPDRAIYWAEHDVHNEIEPALPLTTLAIAASAHINQGQLDLAQSSCRKGFLLATEMDNKPQIMHYMGIQAHILFERGKLQEAIKLAQEAVSIDERSFQARRSYIIHARALIDIGNYEEALGVVERAERTKPIKNEHSNTTLDGTLAIIKARIYFKLVDLNKTMEIIAVWRPKLQQNPALFVILNLMEARVLARRGDKNEALAICESQRDIIQSKMATSKAMNINLHAASGRIHYDIGDFSTAHKSWTQYINSRPNPVELPDGFLRLGECCEKLGNMDEAISAYRNGVALGIETLAASKCGLRLAALSNQAN